MKPLQWADGTHRLAEPVSKMTGKGCGGVPMLMLPKYWVLRKLWRVSLKRTGADELESASWWSETVAM